MHKGRGNGKLEERFFILGGKQAGGDSRACMILGYDWLVWWSHKDTDGGSTLGGIVSCFESNGVFKGVYWL